MRSCHAASGGSNFSGTSLCVAFGVLVSQLGRHGQCGAVCAALSVSSGCSGQVHRKCTSCNLARQTRRRLRACSVLTRSSCRLQPGPTLPGLPDFKFSIRAQVGVQDPREHPGPCRGGHGQGQY